MQGATFCEEFSFGPFRFKNKDHRHTNEQQWENTTETSGADSSKRSAVLVSWRHGFLKVGQDVFKMFRVRNPTLTLCRVYADCQFQRTFWDGEDLWITFSDDGIDWGSDVALSLSEVQCVCEKAESEL